MRVYCGLASAGQRVPVAVVDDTGRLLTSREIDDTPTGYAEVCSLIVGRCAEAGGVRAYVATDSETRLVTLLLAAAGEPLAVGDAATIAQFLTDEPAGAGDPHRRAVALARALQAGTLAAASQPVPRDLTALRPVLAAHRAAATGHSASVATLRDLLRELYPAALRTFPDPGDPLALAMLELLPDPVQISRGQDGDVAAQLNAAGHPDAEAAVAALRSAVVDMTSRGVGVEAVGPAVRSGVASVRSAEQTMTALIRVIAERVEPRTGGHGFPAVGSVSAAPVSASPVSSQPASAQPISGQPAAAAPPAMTPPVMAPPTTPPPVMTPPTLTPPVMAPPAMPQQPAPHHPTQPTMPAPAFASPPHAAAPPPPPETPPSAAPISASPVFTPPPAGPPAPGGESTAEHPPVPVAPPPPPRHSTAEHPVAPQQPSFSPFAPPRPEPPPYELAAPRPQEPLPPQPGPPQPLPPQPLPPQPGPPQPAPSYQEQPSQTFPAPPPTFAPHQPPTGQTGAAPSLGAPPPATGPIAPGHSVAPGGSPAMPGRPGTTGGPAGSMAPGSAPPAGPLEPMSRGMTVPHDSSAVPDQSDEELSLLTPDELPVSNNPQPAGSQNRRTREPASGRLGALIEFPRSARRNRPEPSPAVPPQSQQRRDTKDEPTEEYRPPSPRRQPPPEAPTSAAPVSAGDGDLLIFAQARSAWFTGDDEEETERQAEWRTAADIGWNAAEAASQPTVGGTTTSGLPRRVPHANLVPGSATHRDRQSHPINRDAAQLAAHTAGYFRGWNRARQDAQPPDYPSARHQ